jgi:hypothetical protein
MHGLKAKTLKRMLKKAGLRTSGKKATLRMRAKKAHLVRGGEAPTGMSLGSAEQSAPVGGGNSSYSSMEGPGVVGASYMLTGGRRGGVKAKTLKKLLKKAGLRTSGKKSTLRARAKSAHLIRGGMSSFPSNEVAASV